jgi:hypothetical protein
MPLCLVEVDHVEADVADAHFDELAHEGQVAGIIAAGHPAEGLFGGVVDGLSEFVHLAPGGGAGLFGKQGFIHQAAADVAGHLDAGAVGEGHETAGGGDIPGFGLEAGALVKIDDGEVDAHGLQARDGFRGTGGAPFLNGARGIAAAAEDEGERLHVGGGDDAFLAHPLADGAAFGRGRDGGGQAQQE